MNKRRRNTYLTIVLFVCIVAFCSCSESADESQEVANNYIAAGYVTQHNGMYYGPFGDEWKLYQMGGIFMKQKKLSETRLSPFPYVQYKNNKLFYEALEAGKPDEQLTEQSWIYSLDPKEGKELKLTRSDITLNNFCIYGDQIFFTTIWQRAYINKDGGQIYRMKIDGSDLTLLGDFKGNKYIQIFDGRIYLSGSSDPMLITMDLDGSNVESQNFDRVFILCDLLVYGDSIYFTVSDNNPEQPEENGGIQNPLASGLYKRSLSDSNEEPIGLIKGDIVSFSILRNKIYFAGFVNENDEQQKIYETDLDGNNMKFLANGIMPNAVGEYLFYNSSDPPYGITWLPIK